MHLCFISRPFSATFQYVGVSTSDSENKSGGFPGFLRLNYKKEWKLYWNWERWEEDEWTGIRRFKTWKQNKKNDRETKRKDVNISVCVRITSVRVTEGKRENDRGEERRSEQQDTRDERQKQVFDSRTEALCSVGKVVYCPAVLQCINYRIRNYKLCCAAMNRRVRDRRIADSATGCWLSQGYSQFRMKLESEQVEMRFNVQWQRN